MEIKAYMSLPATHQPGGIYCARWCGCGCTKAAFDQATSEAAALAKDLGQGWLPHVFENIGWHYKATKGKCDISPDRKGDPRHGGWAVRGYTVYLNLDKQFVVAADLATDALGLAVHEARTCIARMEADLAALG